MENECGRVSLIEQSDLVFDEEGDEIGTVTYGMIDYVFVAPEHRRQGHARRMITEAILELEKTYSEIRICACPQEDGIDMARVVEFYEDCGFSVLDANGQNVILSMEF